MPTIDNPMQTDGFEFIEFVSPDPDTLAAQFEQMGFAALAKHKRRDIVLFRQGEINFLLNREAAGPQADFAKAHGPSACAMGFRVKDAPHALKHALSQGAIEFKTDIVSTEYPMPAIEAIGGAAIYFVDGDRNDSFVDRDFEFFSNVKTNAGLGLTYIDHLTHNVMRGHMDTWAEYYERIFNFREIRFFDIKGEMTGLVSRAMTSPCNKIRIPLNEGTDDNSQIEEFLRDFNGEGIQHIALGSDDIYLSIETMRHNNVAFLTVPDTYYDAVEQRIPWHQENLSRLQQNKILIDGESDPEQGLLLQIFTENMLGPVFFEFIQRKGNEGFGEGNFQALFEAIERDQIRRGVLGNNQKG
jgi:4-hydroxyphenylpyruvate dioxygenase